MPASGSRLSASGVVGEAGRVPARDPEPARSAGLRLAGRPLPLVGTARVYVCGITPYDVTHLGHAATFVWADTVAAVARAMGVDVRVARNVTDVDDVLFDAAARGGLPYDELALTGEYRLERDLGALAVQRVDEAPRARAHVGAVVELAAALLATGAAYERDGEVWFRGEATVAASGLSEEEALRRSELFGDTAPAPGPGSGAGSVWDVPVWRRSGADAPAWPSPWGRDWAYAPDRLEAAGDRLARLYAAAARPAGTRSAEVEASARGAVLDRLLDDLDVSGALDLGEAEGGASARAALSLLRLV
ncbi:hypothetical protein KLP28_07755 [Nocardioidaceae bacterium]|nr:hypothetical protein KLP28_07755 [Nocardioidaceae bacterium]